MYPHPSMLKVGATGIRCPCDMILPASIHSNIDGCNAVAVSAGVFQTRCCSYSPTTKWKLHERQRLRDTTWWRFWVARCIICCRSRSLSFEAGIRIGSGRGSIDRAYRDVSIPLARVMSTSVGVAGFIDLHWSWLVALVGPCCCWHSPGMKLRVRGHGVFRARNMASCGRWTTPRANRGGP